ncbi:hypothetical protein F511_20509 [Dorcoceras hygrometricum]|uniref:Uncharacterized protein n=1 Tax=Dorcoceras hygrometricum TaxID=472368 RepID=A0A2Z7CMT6_9LAMI|nr:hypothetical protein F511_20509 [Dorcoceras hygrometricum]
MPPSPPPLPRVAGIRSGRFDEENPFVQNSSVLLVQADEGVSFLVVDRIGDIYRSLPRRADVIVTTVGARHKCQQVIVSRLLFYVLPLPRRGADPDPQHIFNRMFERAVARISRCYLEIAIAKRCRLHKLIRQRFALALKIQQEDFALIISAVAGYSGSSRNARFPDAVIVYPDARRKIYLLLKKIQAKQWTTRRKQQQHPVESYNESTVATHPVVGKSSRELQYPVAGNSGAKNRRSSKAQQLKNESAAKQLTTYKEFTKAGCQLLSSIQMAKTTRSLQKKRTQVLFSCRYFTEHF